MNNLLNRILIGTPDAIENILVIFGLDNTFGKILIYVVFTLIVMIFLLAINLKGFIMVLILVFILGLFIFLGFLPVWFYLTIILGLIFGFMDLKSGGVV